MITVLVGTNRPNANSRKLALQIQSMYAALGERVRIWTWQTCRRAPLRHRPMRSARRSCSPSWMRCSMRARLHVVVPEYNGGAPGVLKYFIDLLPFPESLRGDRWRLPGWLPGCLARCVRNTCSRFLPTAMPTSIPIGYL